MESKQKIEKENAENGREIKHIGIAATMVGLNWSSADRALKEAGYELEDLCRWACLDDDYLICCTLPEQGGEVEKVGYLVERVEACVAANKVHGCVLHYYGLFPLTGVEDIWT